MTLHTRTQCWFWQYIAPTKAIPSNFRRWWPTHLQQWSQVWQKGREFTWKLGLATVA